MVSCVGIHAVGDVDIIELDAASHTGVDTIRELRDEASYAPMRARHRVYVIDEVHMLSKGAFNALLKTLEEPPPHVVFLFATTEPHKVLDTILSRVQVLKLAALSEAQIAARLSEVFAADEALGVVRRVMGDGVRVASVPGLVFGGHLGAESAGRAGLEPGDRIVLVVTASRHREAAFEAAAFLMDYLKTKAPFWKKEAGAHGAEWVDAREADDNATARWDS